MQQRSQTPQGSFGRVEAVRIVDGSSVEMFRWSRWGEMSAGYVLMAPARAS